ncbi:MAG: penicillin-binding protein 2 [Pseudomonadota bacterium]
MNSDQGHIGFAGVSRAALVAAAFAATFVMLGFRGVHVALAGQGLPAALVSGGELGAPRADIIDRNGELLATSVTAYSLVADPLTIWDPEQLVAQLMTILPTLERDALVRKLSNRERRFEWVERGLTPRQMQAVFDLGLEGLSFRLENHRVYPRGSQAGHLLGHVDVDGVGRMGVERAFDAELSRNEEPLQLTIDSGIQFALEQELSDAAETFGIEGAAGVVIEAASGEIRAFASWPAYDPNRPEKATDAERLNRVSGAVFELGSIFKPFTIAAALEADAIQVDDVFDVRRPIVVAGKAITDTHRGTADMSVTQIVAESSNIGTVQISQRLGGEVLRQAYQRYGLFDRAPVDFGVSAAPLLPQHWGELEEATISYGHGIAVTPLSFAAAFVAFANGGDASRLHVRAGDRDADGETEEVSRSIITRGAAEQVREMLRATVTDGTGASADVPGFQVAGKTGTAEKPIPGGYAVDRNITSFAALFPASSPEYVVLIVLDDPRAGEGEGATAAFNAAPTAGRVIERIAPQLGVMPVLDLGPQDARASTTRRAL